MKTMQKALLSKLEEFEKKAKELEKESTKFSQGKANVLASLANNVGFKKAFIQKLDDAKTRLH